MIPIPQYPLYSASIDMYGGKPVYYYLDEDNEWSIDVSNLICIVSKWVVF